MNIFSYGSLVNEKSLKQTSKNAEILGPATLHGYQRKFNAMSDQFPDVALNIVPNTEIAVQGAVIDFLEVEHVGSTATPGLIAKPIIDMNVAIPPS